MRGSFHITWSFLHIKVFLFPDFPTGLQFPAFLPACVFIIILTGSYSALMGISEYEHEMGTMFDRVFLGDHALGASR